MNTCLQKFVSLNVSAASQRATQSTPKLMNVLQNARCSAPAAKPPAKVISECMVVYVDDAVLDTCYILDFDALPDATVLYGEFPNLLKRLPKKGEMFGYLLHGKYMFRAMRIGAISFTGFFKAVLIDTGRVFEISAKPANHFEVTNEAKSIPAYAKRCKIFMMPDELSITDVLYHRICYRILYDNMQCMDINVLSKLRHVSDSVPVEDDFLEIFRIDANILPSSIECYENDEFMTTEPIQNGYTPKSEATQNAYNSNPFIDITEEEIAMELSSAQTNPFFFDDNFNNTDADDNDDGDCCSEDSDGSQVTVVEIQQVHDGIDETVDQMIALSKKGRLCQSLCGLMNFAKENNLQDVGDEHVESPQHQHNSHTEHTLNSTDTSVRHIEKSECEDNLLAENLLSNMVVKNDHSSAELTIINAIDVCDESKLLNEDEIDAIPYDPNEKPSSLPFIIPTNCNSNKLASRGDRISILVSSIENVNNFYAYATTDGLNTCYNEFLKVLNSAEHKANLKSFNVNNPHEFPKVFDYVFVKFGETIYRGRVVGKFDTYLFWVNFIDHGECAKIKIQDLCHYDMKWNEYAAFVNCYRINGIKEFVGTHFDGKYFEGLKAILCATSIEATVIDVQSHKARKTFVVDLLDENGMNIAHTMVRLNLAVLDS